MSAVSMLRHAATKVAERGRAYGDARQSMEAIAQRWSLTLGRPVTAARWKEICWAVGLARATAHQHWLYGLCVITWRLNDWNQSRQMGRRQLIERVRIWSASAISISRL